jgi:hypothetical protein
MSDLTVPDGYLQAGFFIGVGYIGAAIAWGVRVELKLAQLFGQQHRQAEEQAEQRRVQTQVLAELRNIGTLLVRLEERQDRNADDIKGLLKK